MSAFKIAALQKALEDSVPSSDLDKISKEYHQLTEKYRDLLDKGNTLVSKAEAITGLEVRFQKAQFFFYIISIVCLQVFFWICLKICIVFADFSVKNIVVVCGLPFSLLHIRKGRGAEIWAITILIHVFKTNFICKERGKSFYLSYIVCLHFV